MEQNKVEASKDTRVTAAIRTLPSKAIAEVSNDRLESVAMEPLLLNASFRTGSTWLWEKIRNAPTTFAYYEIFHEWLAEATPARTKAKDFKGWTSRHPPMPPYFLEYLPFVRPEGGVAGYDRAMAFDGFVPRDGPDGALAPSQHDYVERLVAAARPSGRIPVLSCTRSLGRARALRRAVGGRTILVHRNLFHQWASYCSYAEAANPYFLDTVRMILEASAHVPFLNRLASYFDVANPSLPREELFQAFVLMHLYLQSFAFDVADIVVDTTEIATDASVRRRIERELSDMIRSPLDLSDARHVCELPDVGFVWSKTVRETIDQFAKLIPTAGRSVESIRFVEQTKERALEEWERFEFFNRKTRVTLSRRIDELEERLAAQATVSKELATDKERLDTELSEVSRAAASEKEALTAELSEVSRAAASEKEALTAELSEAARAAASEKEALAAELSEAARAAALEKETLAQRIASAEDELSGLRAQVASLSTERDLLAVAAATATARQDALEQELAGSLLQRVRRHFLQRIRR